MDYILSLDLHDFVSFINIHHHSFFGTVALFDVGRQIYILETSYTQVCLGWQVLNKNETATIGTKANGNSVVTAC